MEQQVPAMETSLFRAYRCFLKNGFRVATKSTPLYFFSFYNQTTMTAGQFIGKNCKNTPAVDSQADTDTDIH